MVSQDNLTKPIVVSTKVPCPPESNTLHVKPSSGDQGKQETIELRACSEYTEYAASVQYFNSGGKLQTLQDFAGQPMVFAVGQNKILNCLIHEPGKRSGWSLNFLSPTGDDVVAFDVLKVGTESDPSTAGLFIAVATTKGAEGWTTIHHTFLPVTVITDGDVKTLDLDFKSKYQCLNWTTMLDPVGKKSITTLYIAQTPKRPSPATPYLLIGGTKELANKAATFYIIDPSPGIADPWTPYAPDTSEDIIKDIQPASLGTAVSDGEASNRQDGLWVLSGKADRTDVLFYAVDPTTGKKSHSLSTLRPVAGKVQSMWSSRNPWGFTDLVLACEKGVCFLNHQNPTEDAQQVQGLPNTLFTQVVCSEILTLSSDTSTAITMFAISGVGELYFIEGSRNWSSGVITLRASGLPIRANVTRISAQYNAKLDSSELMYASTGNSQVTHVLRDPLTKCWSDDPIRFPTPKSIKKYQAFVTTLSVKSSTGRAVAGLTVAVQSQSAVVLINERSYALSNSAIKVKTNNQGQIVVVSASEDSLAAPTYTFVITNSDITHSETVHGGQRVMNMLSQINKDGSLADVKTSTGAAVFSSSDTTGKEADFKEGAQFLGEFPTMMKAVSSKSGNNEPGQNIEFGKGDPASGGTVSVNSTAHVAAAFDFLDDLTDFAGDVIEWARDKIKGAFKAVFKVIAKGVKLVLTIAGKVISFVVKAVGPLIKAIGAFLKEKLGIDFGKLFEWLGLTWDNEKTKANQKYLKNSIHQILILPGEFMKSNTAGLDDFFRRLEKDLKPIIGDPTPLKVGESEDPSGQVKKSPLSWLLDNPIINFIMKLNPLSIIIEAFTESVDEVFGDDFKVPNLGQFAQQAADALSKVFKKELDVLLGLFEKLWSRIENVARDPSKVLENLKGAFRDIANSLFDTVENVVKGVWQFMIEILGLVVEFLEGVWKIPLLTDFFEWFTDQEFSIMNAVTWVAVRIFGLIVGEDNVAKYLNFEATGKQLNETAKKSNIFAASSSSTTKPANAHTSNVNFMAMESSVLPKRKQPIKSETAPLLTADYPVTVSSKPKLSSDAQAAIHSYEKASKITTSVVGVLRFGIIVMEAVHVTAEAMDGGTSEKEEENPGLLVPTMEVVGTGLAFAGSITQLCLYETARNHSQEAHDYLEDHNTSRTVGHSISMIGSGCAFLAAGFNRIAIPRKWIPAKTSKGVSLTVSILVSVSSFGEIIGVHLVPEGGGKLGDLGTISDYTELCATTCGLITAGGSFAGGPQGKLVSSIAAASDGLLTLVSLIMGIIGAMEEHHE